MTKRVIGTLLLVVMMLFFVYADAEELSGMSLDELLALRIAVNNEIASRNNPPELEDGLTIADVFPDKVLARYIRDNLGAFSTNDQVSQEQLDTITELSFLSHDDGLSSLEGIGYLHNLEVLNVYWQDGLEEIPEVIGSLPLMYRIDITRCSIDTLPDSICNLTDLIFLRVNETNISELPEDIGNLTSLVFLDISDTNITELPASIYNLKLETFLRDGLDLD